MVDLSSVNIKGRGLELISNLWSIASSELLSRYFPSMTHQLVTYSIHQLFACDFRCRWEIFRLVFWRATSKPPHSISARRPVSTIVAECATRDTGNRGVNLQRSCSYGPGMIAPLLNNFPSASCWSYRKFRNGSRFTERERWGHHRQHWWASPCFCKGSYLSMYPWCCL